MQRFWLKSNAQKYADSLNKQNPCIDSKSPWTVSKKRIRFRFVIQKEFFGNIHGSYFEYA